MVVVFQMLMMPFFRIPVLLVLGLVLGLVLDLLLGLVLKPSPALLLQPVPPLLLGSSYSYSRPKYVSRIKNRLYKIQNTKFTSS